MEPPHSEPRQHLRQLLDALREPRRCAALDDDRLDLLIRVARAARLLGTLSARLRACGVWEALPERARVLLAGAEADARYRRQMTMYEMASVAQAIEDIDTAMVLLKGSAYVAQQLPIAEGRLPRDLDLMVRRERLDDVERALQRRGWVHDGKLTAYDQHYYRAWSHEVPPLRYPGHPFEVDLHHSILPPIGRLKPDAARLIADSVPVPGSPFRVLRPADQVLHAAVHLFQDSDCVGKLRDLVDIDALVRHFSAQGGEGFWQEILDSAAVHDLGRPLWYALAFSRAWLETPVPEPAWERVQGYRPPTLPRLLVTALAARVLPPVDPEGEAGPIDRAAAAALEFRALWLRMPPWTLAYHGANKLVRSMREAPAKPDAA